ncbi:hypothetical protein ACWOBH_05375 [Globicatella sanguinis]
MVENYCFKIKGTWRFYVNLTIIRFTWRHIDMLLAGKLANKVLSAMKSDFDKYIKVKMEEVPDVR